MQQPDPTRPEVLKYLVNYTVTDKDNRSLVLNTTVQSTPAILNYYKGSSYNVTVTPSNVLGEGPGSNISFGEQYLEPANEFYNHFMMSMHLTHNTPACLQI